MAAIAGKRALDESCTSSFTSSFVGGLDATGAVEKRAMEAVEKRQRDDK